MSLGPTFKWVGSTSYAIVCLRRLGEPRPGKLDADVGGPFGRRFHQVRRLQLVGCVQIPEALSAASPASRPHGSG